MVIAQGEEWPRKAWISGWGEKADLSTLLAGYKQGKKSLFVYGRLVYRDAFDKKREIGFCREFDGQNFTYNQTTIRENPRLNYAD